MRTAEAAWQTGGVKSNLPRSGSRHRRRTPDEIRSILVEHARSGLSLLAFAQTHQLCYASLRRWRSTHPPARGGLGAKGIPTPAPDGQATPRFVPVRLEDGELDVAFTVNWPSGRSLRIPAEFDPYQLRRLLQVLEGQP